MHILTPELLTSSHPSSPSDMPSSAPAKFPPASVAVAAGPAPRILLVDDDSDLRKLTRAFLHAEGYEVFSCSDAERALGIFRSHAEIDLLLTDLHMPGLSGIQLAESLCLSRPALRVLLISGAILTGPQWDAIQLHSWAFLAKPFPVPQLLSLVASLLHARSPRAARGPRLLQRKTAG